MLLQTNSYIVPKDKRSEHTRLLRKFRQTLARLGCDQFEVYEQVAANWAGGETTGRFVQIMKFRDRKHQQELQAAEKSDAAAQQLIAEFCALINFPYQQQQGLFAVGFYTSAMPVSGSVKPPPRPPGSPGVATPPAPARPPLAENPAPPAAPPGGSLTEFEALAPEAVADAGAGSEMPTTDALPSVVEQSANGEHGGSFAESPDALEAALTDEPTLGDADREAVIGELIEEDERSRPKSE
jgi:hypothetical protein